MKQNYDFDIEKIKNLSHEEKVFRKKNLDLFYESGFPSKQVEDWKFTDLNLILNKNFNNISNEVNFESSEEFKAIDNFEHNFIFLTNGKIISTNFDHEEKSKILVKDFNQEEVINIDPSNALALLNSALSSGGFSLEITKDYLITLNLITYMSYLLVKLLKQEMPI